MMVGIDFRRQLGQRVRQIELPAEIFVHLLVGDVSVFHIILRMIHSIEHILHRMAKGGESKVGAPVEDLAEHPFHRDVLLALLFGNGGFVVILGRLQILDFGI